MKKLYRFLTLLALPLAVVACKTDYNFDNISLEVTVGDTEGIAVPLGETGSITLESILEESGLGTNADGTYGYQMSDQISYNYELAAINPLTDLAPTIDPISTSLVGDVNTEIPPFEGTKELELPEGITTGMTITEGFPLIGQEFTMHYDPHTFEGEFEVVLPEEIASIGAITFGADGGGSLIDIQFDLGGVAGVADKRHIDKFNIELPAGFTLAKVEGDPVNDYVTIYAGEGSTTPNHFHIENYEMTGDHLTIDLLVKSVDLSAVAIAEGGTITIDEDVTYDLDFTGSFKAGTVEAVSPKVSIKAELDIYEVAVVTNGISHSIEASHSIGHQISIPEEVTAIHSIEVVDNDTDEKGAINLGILIENAPIDRFGIDLEVTLPSYIDISAEQSAWSDNNGTLTLHYDYDATATSGWIELGDFTIEGIKQLDIESGVVDLSSDISFKANVTVPAGEQVTIKAEHEDVVITPYVAISDLKIKSITGVVDPDLSSLIEPIEVEIGDLSSSLEGLELDLNLASPVLRIDIENPLGVGIDATIDIEAHKGGAVVQTLTTPTMTILPAGSEPVTTNLVIVGEEGVVEGECYVVEGLTELIGLLPEKLTISLNATTNKDSAHTITIQDSYTFNASYSVDVPFAFSPNKDGRIKYTTVIEDIDLSSIKDVEVVVESVVLDIHSKSTLPIDLTMAVELLDAEGNPIECITSATEGKIEGTTSTEAKESACSITLNLDTPEGTSPFAELGKTNKVRCTFEGTTLAGGELRPEQAIEAKLALVLDKGITIDLESLIGSEESPEGDTEGGAENENESEEPIA